MIGRDKIAHAAAGALVAVGTLGLLWLAVMVGLWACMLGAAAGVGVGFELAQRLRGEVADPLDALATVAGGMLAALLLGWPS